MRTIKLCLIALTILTVSCKTKEGSIERIDPTLNSIIHEDAKIEVIAESFEWSEGPVWVEAHNMLLFSDVPKNTIYKWTEKEGATVYLTPSGYTRSEVRSGESGSNGLLLNKDGKLVLCQHGDRRLAMMDAPLDTPRPNFITIANTYDGKKFSSPNDAAFHANGDVFMTDPPYGLPKQHLDAMKETPYNGVYRITPSGKVSLVIDSLSRPNGIAFLPGYKTFIVANSDPAKATWYAFDIAGNDSIINARIFYNATKEAKTEKGLPDGLKVDRQGNIFASGPGGIWIFTSAGKLIGKIKLPQATSNCALADNDKTLYVTCDMYIYRIKMR